MPLYFSTTRLINCNFLLFVCEGIDYNLSELEDTIASLKDDKASPNFFTKVLGLNCWFTYDYFHLAFDFCRGHAP